MFLPDDPSYQDIQQQPLLLTMPYTQALQYWVKKFRLPDHPDYHPLAMSIVELMQVVKEQVIFYKRDVSSSLGRTAPETVDSIPHGSPRGTPVTQSTTTDVGRLC